MRLYLVLAAACLVCRAAAAETPDCRAIADPVTRLACYDRAIPPTAPAGTARPIRAVPQSKIDSTGYVELDQRRGCADERADERNLPRLLNRLRGSNDSMQRFDQMRH